MKLYFKQRMFSWFDSYDIYHMDDSGAVAFTVEGKLAWRLFIEKCAKDAKKLAKWKASGYNKRIETHRKKEILMLDIKVIRQDPERVKAAMKSRNKDMDKEINEILAIDVERRAINVAVDNMKAEQNRVSKLIPQYKKEGKDVAPILAEMKELSDKITEDGAKLAELEEKIADYGRRIERGEAIRQEIKQRRAQAFEAIRQAQIDVSVAQERVRTLTAQREEHRAQQDRCALLRTQIAQNLAQIDSQLAGARDTQAGEQKTNEEMNRQTAALSDALYEKREALDALREEAQNLRVTLAACERDANALNQDGARGMRSLRKLR